MRSLKPKETTANAISVKAAADLQNEIARLQEQIVQLRSNIDAIENTLKSPNVGRGNATFGTLESTDLNVNRNTTLQKAEVSDLTADKIETPDIEAENATVTNVLDANQINTPELNADVVKTDSVQSDEVTTDDLTTTTFSATKATVGEVTINNANITTANIGNYVTNKVTANEVETASLNTDEVTTEEATVTKLTAENAEVQNAEIEKARIENRYYISDKPGKTIQLTQVEEQHPAWICLDTRGVQNAKIIAKDLTGELFSVIYSNTRNTPLIQWSKKNDNAIQRFFYNYKTNKLYIETWRSCEFQWQIDGYEETPFIPQTFQDDFPESLLDCYKYSVSRKHGIVLMGEQGADTVLSVQGAIEGSFLIDDDEFVYLNFYSDSAWDLFNVAKNFFRSGSDEDGWQYEKAQVFGYLRHTDTVAPAYTPYTFTSSSEAYQQLNSMSGPRTVADKTFVDTDPLVNSVDCVYVTGGSTQLYTTVNGEYKKILKVCTTSDIAGAADYLWPIVWVEGDDVTSLAGVSIRLLEPRTVGDIPNLFEDVSYYTATGSSHSPYRDEDNTEIEALEKVEMVDENTILLTIDSKYGQDEITIEGNSLTEDEKLPFVLGFTIRTPKIDYTFNREAKTIAGKSDNSYYGG